MCGCVFYVSALQRPGGSSRQLTSKWRLRDSSSFHCGVCHLRVPYFLTHKWEKEVTLKSSRSFRQWPKSCIHYFCPNSITLVTPWDPTPSNLHPSQGWQVVAVLGVPWAFCWPAPGLVLVMVCLGSQQGLSHMPPGPIQAAIKNGLLYISYQVALGRSQSVVDLGLHRSPSQETSEPTYLVAGFRPQ